MHGTEQDKQLYLLFLVTTFFFLQKAETINALHSQYGHTALFFANSQGFPCGTSDKEPACQCRRHKRCEPHPWVRKILWRRRWQPTPVFSPGEFHGQRSLAGYVYGVAESRTRLKGRSTHRHTVSLVHQSLES